jgi:hypothetical protein
MLRFNRKKLVQDVYEQPPFSLVDKNNASVTMVSRPTAKEIKAWDRSQLRRELSRRGYTNPPYNIKILNEDGTSAFISIKSDTCVAAPGLTEAKEFAKGLPKVRKMEDEKMRALLRLVGRDPRFVDGQPIVQPAYYQRSCQNCSCCCLFLAYWVGMIILAVVALVTGNPYRLIRPIDYQGEMCGGAHHPGMRTLYYPRLAEDAFSLYTDGDLNCQDTAAGCFYGICVESCPNKGDIVCNYEVEALLVATIDLAADRALARSTRANEQNGCWRVQMQQVELFQRCLPYARAEEKTQYWCDIEKFAPDGVSLVRSLTPIGTDNCACQWAGDLPKCPVLPAPLPDPIPAEFECTDANVCTGERACNEREMELKLNSFCRTGVIRRQVTSTAEYTQGTEKMAAFMSSFIMYFESLMSDVTNCWFVSLAPPQFAV